MIRSYVVTAFVCLMVASPVMAQEAGVFVDPDSPAGTEYAIPLEQARDEAAADDTGTDGGAGARGTEPSRPFGVGIEPVAGRAQEPGAPGPDGGGRAKGEDDRQNRRRIPGPGDIAPKARSFAAIEAAASEGSDWLPTVGIAAAMVAAGLLAGFSLRRLLRGS